MTRPSSLPRIALIAIVLATPTAARAQAKVQPAPTAAAPASKAIDPTLALQRERLEFDRQKHVDDQAAENTRMNLEREKLALEREKIAAERAKVPWTVMATIVPLVGILLTFGYSLWSFRRQLELQVRAQQESARLEFEIKAAEIAFQGKTPHAVLNRGRALQKMFSNRLPASFLSAFDPKDFGGDAEPAEPKHVLLDLLMKYPDKQAMVLKLWKQLLPGDHAWINRVNPDA